MKDTVYPYRIPFKIAMLADLHDRPFDPVIRSLEAHRPEVICIAGDVVHRLHPNESTPAIHQTRNALPFLRACAGIAPTFFSLGNHEWPLGAEDIRIISETGVTVLENTWCAYKNVLFGGLTSAGVTAYQSYRQNRPERYPAWTHGDEPDYTRPETAWLTNFCRQPQYKILLCHHPEYRDRHMGNMPVELVLSGHAHGGQICLFGRGLYAPGQGIFPKYTAGIHGNLIVTRGLSNTAGIIPRVFNPMETVYIEPQE